MSRHKPVRTCVGCGKKRFRHELLRIVRTPAGQLEIDARANKAGRGAYLCYNLTCFEQAARRQAIHRSLKTAATDEFLRELQTFLANK